jgi:hypothetical protein
VEADAAAAGVIIPEVMLTGDEAVEKKEEAVVV